MASITIQSSRFGAVQVDEAQLIRFVSPIFGFENKQVYVLLDHSDDSPFCWLQSTEDPDLAFVITNPKFFGIPYEFPLPDEIAGQLSLQTAEDALVFTIVNIPHDHPGQMTANLLGPIVVNQQNKAAMQIVLNDSEFSTKTRLIPDDVLNSQSSPSSVTPASAGDP